MSRESMTYTEREQKGVQTEEEKTFQPLEIEGMGQDSWLTAQESSDLGQRLFDDDGSSAESFGDSDRALNVHENDVSQSKTNQKLLSRAFLTFTGFALIQAFAAVMARSEAMMGDSAAMIVDAFTYCFNWMAEREKSKLEENSDFQRDSQQVVFGDDLGRHTRIQREKRKRTLQMELIPPLISVTTLLVVTSFVLKEAIETLYFDLSHEDEQRGDPNISLMLFFSFMNLLLDVFNVLGFANAKHLCGYRTVDDRTHQAEGLPTDEVSADACDDVDDVKDSSNLNMCSAYTHVFADTIRSIAVLIAAGIAEVVDGVSGDEADAAAALIVGILIALSLIPLFQGFMVAYAELGEIAREERAEAEMR